MLSPEYPRVNFDQFILKHDLGGQDRKAIARWFAPKSHKYGLKYVKGASAIVKQGSFDVFDRDPIMQSFYPQYSCSLPSRTPMEHMSFVCVNSERDNQKCVSKSRNFCLSREFSIFHGLARLDKSKLFLRAKSNSPLLTSLLKCAMSCCSSLAYSYPTSDCESGTVISEWIWTIWDAVHATGTVNGI